MHYIYENVLKLSCLVMSIFTSVFFVQINNFVSLWIGNKYILENVCVLMFSIILFMNVVLNVLTIGVDAEGLYKETKMIAVGQANKSWTDFIIYTFLGNKRGVNRYSG